ncbi:MAG: lysophospholipase [Pseudomonadales bacterium]
MNTTFTLTAADQCAIHCHKWTADAPKAVVQIIHGGAEHAGRYAALADRLCSNRYSVYAEDHRGHGVTGQLNSKLGDMGEPNAFDRVCDDVCLLTNTIREENPGLPVILLGHSLGSLVTQKLLLNHSHDYSAAILSGSPDILSVAAGSGLVDAEAERLGRGKISDALEAGIVEGFNAAFPDATTPSDWLSRDPDQVQRYVNDPLCGYPLCVGVWQDLIAAMLVTAERDAVAAVRVDLPIYIFSGEADPAHNNWGSIKRLEGNYKAAGISDLTVRSYPGGRHEMLNEINSDVVMRDMLEWLEERFGG